VNLLVVDDEKLFRWSLIKTLTRAGYQTLEGGTVEEAKQRIVNEEPDIVLLDINLPDGSGIDVLKWARNSFPDMMFIMVTGRGKVKDAVDAMRSGAQDYLEKPIDMESLVEHVNRVREMVELKRELSRLNQAGTTERAAIVAESSPMTEAVRLARAAAESGAQTILLLGESGCGKDLMSRFVHEHSHRANKPFMVINCAAIPENLLESELFGFEKGAFTDAKNQKKGILELANEGTVFLDEIGEMKPSMQSKLLRVLEDWTFKRVGGTRDIKVDVRVIAATNQDLGELVNAKEFREDLYYRFNVFPIEIPPLRKRPEDISALAQHFVTVYNAKFGKKILGFSREAMDSLASYPWPGNVRELRNVVERAMILQTDPQISSVDFPLKKDGSRTQDLLPGILPLADAERFLIQRALSRTHGNVVQAARLLKISRDKLRYKIKKHQLE
jgi:DNA-binding NtrC family response regulator